MTDTEAYLRLLGAFAANPLSDRSVRDLQDCYRRLGADREAAVEAAGLIAQLATKFARDPAFDPSRLGTVATESTGVHWDASDDGWEYQQYDTEKSSNKVRRMRVETGWLYQVELTNFEDPLSAEAGRRISGWHPPVFVPAPPETSKPRTIPIPAHYTKGREF